MMHGSEAALLLELPLAVPCSCRFSSPMKVHYSLHVVLYSSASGLRQQCELFLSISADPLWWLRGALLLLSYRRVACQGACSAVAPHGSMPPPGRTQALGLGSLAFTGLRCVTRWQLWPHQVQAVHLLARWCTWCCSLLQDDGAWLQLFCRNIYRGTKHTSVHCYLTTCPTAKQFKFFCVGACCWAADTLPAEVHLTLQGGSRVV
jgi:hypothetical protein